MFDTAYPQILANLAAGNQPLATLDSNLTPIYNGLLAVGTYNTYYADSGAANAYVITITARQSLALAAGLRIQFKAANVNTGASTLNANGTGAKNILRVNGTALAAGDIPANGIADVMYDGTQFLLLSPYAVPTVTASLGSDVALNNTGNFFDGPSVAQGTVGTWWASGTVTLRDTAGVAAFFASLYDGTTVAASATTQSSGANVYTTISLSGRFVSPAGNIRIIVKDPTSTSGLIIYNASGNAKDSTITAKRIA